MKLCLQTLILMLGAIFVAANCFAQNGNIQFCQDLTDKFEPVNPGDEFAGPAVSWLASASAPFGKPTIVISIYKDSDTSQSLVQRRDLEVNPAWDNIGLRNMPIGEPGQYTLTLTRPDGEEIATGKVKILPAVSDKPVAPEEKLGATLEALFNKYKPGKK